MGFFRRLLGRCETKPPVIYDCWRFGGKRIEIDLSRAPELEKPGGAMRIEAPGLPLKVLVMRDRDGRFRAFENRCTHMGRRLDPLFGEGRLRCCSAGMSEFEYSGRNVSGPAKEPVNAFEVSEEGESLVVYLS